MTRHYSHTQLQMFEGCPRQYKFRYRDGLPGTTNGPMLNGSLTHSVIERYTRHLAETEQGTDLSILPEMIRQEYFKKPVDTDLVTLDELAESVGAFARTHVLNYQTVAGVEERMEFELWPGVTFVVIVDLLQIDGPTADITDYKTGWKILPPSEVMRNPQLHRYCWGVGKMFPQIQEFRASLHFTRFGYAPMVTFDRSIVEETEERIKLAVEQIERETEFAPRPGDACAYCAYVGVCPAAKAAEAQTGLVVVTDPEQARTVAERITLLESQTTALKKSLSGWCKTAGPVKTNGQTWGYWPSESKKVTDVPGFMALVQAKGDNPHRYITVDGRTAKKFADDPEFAPVFGTEKSTRFDSKSIKDGEAS